MEVLTDYVRDTAPWIPQEARPLPEGQALVLQSPRMHTPASSTAEGPALRSTPTDIQAILTVIGRCTRSPNREGEYRLDLHNTDLRSADLREARLERALLRRAHLEGADLTVAQLITVRTLQGASLDRNLEEEIRGKAAHLL